MPADPSDDELARRVAGLFEQHRAAVFAYLTRLARDARLAEEATQDTFLKVYAARDRLPQIENERAWIFRIATNTCLTALRRGRRHWFLPWERAEQASVERDAPAQVIERDAVERALASLDEKHRAPLILFSQQGFKVAEIAEILNISAGAVRTRVYRAKEMFLRAYRQDEDA